LHIKWVICLQFCNENYYLRQAECQSFPREDFLSATQIKQTCLSVSYLQNVSWIDSTRLVLNYNFKLNSISRQSYRNFCLNNSSLSIIWVAGPRRLRKDINAIKCILSRATNPWLKWVIATIQLFSEVRGKVGENWPMD